MNTENLQNIIDRAMVTKVDEVAPKFRKKNFLNEEQIKRIIDILCTNHQISPEKALIAMDLLFLQGAASAGAPPTMMVEVGDGKCIEKRNIIDACNLVTSHQFIRRIAESLALQIGEFAYKNKLAGELAYRINNKLKADTGESLTEKEMAYCSSFSQAIPNLAEYTSDRLVKLLAEDYQRRFDRKKKQRIDDITNNINKIKGKKKKKK